LAANGPGVPDFSDLDTYALTLTMNWDTSLGQITSISGYKKFDLREFTDADGTPFWFMDTDRPTDGWQFSQEVRGNFNPSDNVNLIVGGFYTYQTYHHEQNFRPMFALRGLRQLTQEWQDKWTASVFAHSFITLTPKLTLQVGGRYSHEDTKMKDSSENFLNFGCDFTCDTVWSGDTSIGGFVVSGSDSWDDWAAKIGLDYKVNDDVLLYGFYSRGFKSGGFVGRITYPQDIGPFDPEYVDTIEGGIKSDLMGGRLRVNLAGFYNWYKDMQLPIIYYGEDEQTGAVQHSSTIINAAKSETYGFELEATTIPVEGLTINGSVGYLHAEYTDFPFIDPSTVGPVIPEQINLKGYRLQNSPKWTYTFGARYEFPLGSGLAAIGGEFQHVGNKYNTNLQNTPRSEIQPTDYINANLEWTPDDRRWSINIWALNLADERYIDSVFDGGAGSLALVSYAPPRQYGVSFNYNW